MLEAHGSDSSVYMRMVQLGHTPTLSLNVGRAHILTAAHAFMSKFQNGYLPKTYVRTQNAGKGEVRLSEHPLNQGCA